jgi:hypothetical protein
MRKETTPDVRSYKREIQRLTKLAEQQEQRIKRLSRSKFKIPRAPKSVRAATFYRPIIPDTHGCYVDQQALAAMLADLAAIGKEVRELVMLGDHLDCGGFLAQHHTIGYVAEAAYTFEDDVVATNTLLDEIQRICPKAVIYYLEGNHERRIERWCVTQALANKQSASYLASMFSTEKVLHLEKRNIRYYKQGQFYDGLRIPATIRLGRCHFTHGSRTGANPAAATLRDFGGNVVFGHVHRMDSAASRTVKEGEIGAWSPGCLCRLQPLWNHTQITGWAHGYGLQLVRGDGDFLHVNVPIIDGKSYLIPFTGRAA